MSKLIESIEKYNTHSMSDEIVLAVNTGRENLIDNIHKIIIENIKNPVTIQNIVLIGPRGMGKSFILRYFEIITKNKFNKNTYIEFSLLPEEQYNINAPSELLEELLLRINNINPVSRSSVWNNINENWEGVVENLNIHIQEKIKKHKNYLFIAAIENLDVLLEKVFSSKTSESKLRKLLSDTPNFMLLGTSLNFDIDTDYNKRLFHAFQKYLLDPWEEKDFVDYFNKRYELIKKQKPENTKKINILKNKLRAISRFTGGSPRIAVVLTNLLFNEDVVSTIQTLNNIVEDMSPYYQNLMLNIPPKSRILFDALMRSDENISQSEIAKKVNTQQSVISQAFKWLLENNYIRGHKIKGEKQYRYSVSDRIFVLFYYKRYIYNSLQYNNIKVLSDFLISFYETSELIDHSLSCIKEGITKEGIELAKLVFQKKGIDNSIVDWDDCKDIKETLNGIRSDDEISSFMEKASKYDSVNDYNKAIEYYLKAYNKANKENNIVKTTMSLMELGICYLRLGKHKKSIDCIYKALDAFKMKDNINGQTVAHNILGLNYYILKQFKKSIEHYKQTLLLDTKNNNISQQVYTYKLIGYNYYCLKDFRRSNKYYLKAIKIPIINKNTLENAIILQLIGLNYHELKKHEKSNEFLLKANDIFKKEKKSEEQAKCLSFIGVNYLILNQYEDSINYTKKALGLAKKINIIQAQPTLLNTLGLNYLELKQYEKSIEFAQKALQLSIEQKNKSWQGMSQMMLGKNFLELKQLDKAKAYYKKSFSYFKDEKDKDGQIICLGNIINIDLLLGNDNLWNVFNKEIYSHLLNEKLFKELGNSILLKEKWEGKPEAFKMANKIISVLLQEDININISEALKNIFAYLLKNKVSFDLLKDICYETLEIFGKEEDVIIQATLHCIDYINAEKNEKYLQKLNPDMAIAVEAIINEAGL